MPWGSYTNWTEEDRHAVVVYLRNINAVAHRIPPPSDQVLPFVDPAAIEVGDNLQGLFVFHAHLLETLPAQGESTLPGRNLSTVMG